MRKSTFGLRKVNEATLKPNKLEKKHGNTLILEVIGIPRVG